MLRVLNLPYIGNIIYKTVKKDMQRECRKAYNYHMNKAILILLRMAERKTCCATYFATVFVQDDNTTLPDKGQSPYPDLPLFTTNVNC